MRKRGRVDANQEKIVKQLRQAGFSVAVTSSLGNGFPDLVIGYHNRNYLVEIKDGDKPKSQKQLTSDEKEFIESWRGSVIVAESIDDILTLF